MYIVYIICFNILKTLVDKQATRIQQQKA